MNEVVALKIKQGRLLNGLSLQDLADMIGISKQMISKYEKGDAMPTSKILIQLAKSLKVKMDYFFTMPSVELGVVNFRKKSSFSLKKINILKEEIKIKLTNYIEIENILQIDNSFNNPINQLKINSIDAIEKVVSDLRSEWQIGIDPIHNIIQLLEDKEIKIIEIDEPENKFDGLATIINEKYPVIVINKNFNVERKRFTLLHELGHLLMSLPTDCDVKFEENVCNRFASEFLFPKVSVLKEFGNKRDTISIKELIEVQNKYGISIRAIVYRLKDVKILSENRYTEFYKKINFNTNLKSEVDKERFKTPEISNRYEQLVYRALSQELISSSKAASLLNTNINVILDNSIM